MSDIVYDAHTQRVDELAQHVDELAQLVASHEMALRIVADTEKKMADCMTLHLFLNVMAVFMAGAALLMEVM